MLIAYLVNMYPGTSQSFIRREIAGVEACGIQVARFSVRPWQTDLVDEADKKELQNTRYILKVGIVRLLLSLIHVAVTKPIPFIRTVGLSLKIGLVSDRGVLLHLAYLAEACVLLSWLSKAGITYIHAHFGSYSTTIAMLCSVLGGLTYSFTVHGPDEFDRPRAISLSEKIQRAVFVVGISSFCKSQLLRWCDDKQWSKIHIIRCGVDELFLSKPYVPLPNQPRFVCVGRLSEQKGHLVLIEAVSQLAAEGLELKIVLVGDGPLRRRIETLIAQLGLENYIEIMGWATNAEVQQQILAAQMLVLPSLAEGLPVAIMEAFALSRPVISTYIAGIPELVEHGKSGWLVPSGSVGALSAALRKALNSPMEELVQMGKAGAEHVAKKHNAACEARKLVSLFQVYGLARPSGEIYR